MLSLSFPSLHLVVQLRSRHETLSYLLLIYLTSWYIFLYLSTSYNMTPSCLGIQLLETVIKNCGDMVHMHIADKDIPNEMVKIVKKKPDCHVKEKILVLIDTWLEVFGGPQEKYPQFFIAYQDLLHAGVIFPKRVQMSSPIFLPTQSPSPSSYPHPMRTYDNKTGKMEGSIGSEVLVLSLVDIQSARGIMDILVEMLKSLETENKEGVKQEVIAELVEQCRLYRQRVVHLVNSTSDEKLLCQGLALNDDLQNVLAKYDTLVGGVSIKKPKVQKFLQALVELDDLGDSEFDQRPNACSSTGSQTPLQQLLLPSPPGSNSRAHIDLLSGDEFGMVSVENSLAIVPATETSATADNAQNMLVVSGIYSPTNGGSNNCSSSDITLPELVCSNENSHNRCVSVYEQGPFVEGSQSSHAYPSWNSQYSDGVNAQQQTYLRALDQGSSLPPPPWETELAESSQTLASQQNHFQNEQQSGEIIAHSGGIHGSRPIGMFHTHDQAYDHNAFLQFNSNNAAYSYLGRNEISQVMYGLSVQDNAYKNVGPTYQIPSTSSSSYLQLPMKQLKPEDSLFGDLVSLAKSSKPAK